MDDFVFNKIKAIIDINEKIEAIIEHLKFNFNNKNIYQNILEFSYSINDELKKNNINNYNDLQTFNKFNIKIKKYLNSFTNAILNQLFKLFKIQENILELKIYNLIESNLFPKIFDTVNDIYNEYYQILNNNLNEKVIFF
jgi:hypothetical protein